MRPRLRPDAQTLQLGWSGLHLALHLGVALVLILALRNWPEARNAVLPQPPATVPARPQEPPQEVEAPLPDPLPIEALRRPAGAEFVLPPESRPSRPRATEPGSEAPLVTASPEADLLAPRPGVRAPEQAPAAYRPRFQAGNRGPADAAVQAALRWLGNHQEADGHWDAANFMRHDRHGKPCDGPGNPVHDLGLTALALLAFLGDGHTLRSGAYRDTVVNAVKWISSQQAENGRFGTDASHESIYHHAIATLAMCEAQGLSHTRVLEESVRKAVRFIEQARNPDSAWRYYPRGGTNDSSVTGWMVGALATGWRFGQERDPALVAAVTAWLDTVTDPETGHCGYTRRGEGASRRDAMALRFPPERSQALTGVGLLCRLFLGQDPAATPVLQAAADRIKAWAPSWSEADGGPDFYGFYYCSVALQQFSVAQWQPWFEQLVRVAVAHQRTDGNAEGSWDPLDPWGKDGGRIYATAILALALETPYRYAGVR